MEHYKKLFMSFVYAFKGIFRTIVNERNLRIHITCVVYMVSILLLTDWFTLSRTDWAVLMLACGSVIGGEIVNTAIENAVNKALDLGYRTTDIYKEGFKKVSCSEMGEVISNLI